MTEKDIVKMENEAKEKQNGGAEFDKDDDDDKEEKHNSLNSCFFSFRNKDLNL